MPIIIIVLAVAGLIVLVYKIVDKRDTKKAQQARADYGKKTFSCSKCGSKLSSSCVTNIEKTGEKRISDGPTEYTFRIQLKCKQCGATKSFTREIADEIWEKGPNDSVRIKPVNVEKEIKKYIDSF